MLIKKKSLVVALISSLVICLVLVVNLIGYLIYLELKNKDLDKAYHAMLQRVNAKVYARHIEVARLSAGFERTGPLSGNAILEGIVRNDGYRDISDLLIKVRFLDNDGAVLYETVFHPLEPSLASSNLSAVSIPYLAASRSIIKPESSILFKKILIDCPKEIVSELKKGSGTPQGKGRWAGRLDYEILSTNF